LRKGTYIFTSETKNYPNLNRFQITLAEEILGSSASLTFLGGISDLYLWNMNNSRLKFQSYRRPKISKPYVTDFDFRE